MEAVSVHPIAQQKTVPPSIAINLVSPWGVTLRLVNRTAMVKQSPLRGSIKVLPRKALVLVDGYCYRTGMTQGAGRPCYHYSGLSRYRRCCWIVAVAAAAPQSEQ